jgi:ribonucleoside-diphosphate reductase alpha chain
LPTCSISWDPLQLEAALQDRRRSHGLHPGGIPPRPPARPGRGARRFPNFDKSVFKNRKTAAYRNATTTTIAPTGTLSIIAGCSSGIEPLFALSFVRNVMDNDKLMEVNPYFEKTPARKGFSTAGADGRDCRAVGSMQDIRKYPKTSRKVFVTAHDISPEWHIRMQAAFQKHTDNAVSKTVNLPHDATVDDVRKVYDLAYELGCKGVTIYRDGSKENQVLSFSKSKPPPGTAFMTGGQERPETLEGFTTKMVTGMGHLYVTVTEYEGPPLRGFRHHRQVRPLDHRQDRGHRAAGVPGLRSGVEVAEIVEQLKGIGGEHPVFQEGGLVLSIPDAISRCWKSAT